MSNEAVAGVRIIADGQTLYEQIRPGAAVSAAGEMLPISHLIHSPFDKHQEVGEIVLFASQATLHELAWSYVRYVRSEEHTSELQSLMRNSYAVLCLKKKKHQTHK